MRPRRLIRATVGLVAALSVPALSLTALSVTVPGAGDAAHAAVTAQATTASSCRDSPGPPSTWHYTSKIRDVTATRGATVVTARVATYPGPTTITKSTRVSTNWQVNVRAGLGANFSEQVGGGVSLGKIVSVSDATKFGFNVRVQAGWNTQKSTVVMTSTTYRIPAAHSVVWYAGFQTVHGTFQYSYCKPPASPLGPPTGNYRGTVAWKTAKWTTFSTVRDAGGQRCDLRAETYVAAKAQSEFCIKKK